METKGRGRCRPSLWPGPSRAHSARPAGLWGMGRAAAGRRVRAQGALRGCRRAGSVFSPEEPGAPWLERGPGLVHLPSWHGSWSGPVPTWGGLESGAAGRSSRPRFHPFPMWSGRAEGCKVWQPCPAPLAPTSTHGEGVAWCPRSQRVPRAVGMATGGSFTHRAVEAEPQNEMSLESRSDAHHPAARLRTGPCSRAGSPVPAQEVLLPRRKSCSCRKG